MDSPHLDALSVEQQWLVRRAAMSLVREFDGTFASETVERFVADSLEQLVPNATVTTFLPLLTERFARERLSALARVARDHGRLTVISRAGPARAGHPQQAVPVPAAAAAASGCSDDQPVLGASTPHDIEGASPSTV